ncbi:hypothetical protein [Vacuolonema iberomarrocanum]|uniref:hypothetical protein n=1 Tax=Vacuolonema iberomarrocanum TaxID=3454632 RepID=UPI0019E96D85|nr:hypothetical protein [filamentous cyanobacterium LEGE 07170]
MNVIMVLAAYLLPFLCLLLNSSLFVRLNPPYSFYFVVVQLFAGGLAPVLAILGGVGAVLGWYSGARVAVVAGILGTAISVVYMVLVTAPQPQSPSAQAVLYYLERFLTLMV